VNERYCFTAADPAPDGGSGGETKARYILDHLTHVAPVWVLGWSGNKSLRRRDWALKRLMVLCPSAVSSIVRY
jgi:hypothetical protein